MKRLFFLILLLINDLVIACPGCAGSMGNKKDEYTVYILMGFIALTYIPFYMLYKMIFKYQNLNKIKTKVNEQSI